jgi:hypothetical protein
MNPSCEAAERDVKLWEQGGMNCTRGVFKTESKHSASDSGGRWEDEDGYRQRRNGKKTDQQRLAYLGRVGMSARRVSSGFRPECRLGSLRSGKARQSASIPPRPLVSWADSPSVLSNAPRGRQRQGWRGLLNPTQAVVVPDFTDPEGTQHSGR